MAHKPSDVAKEINVSVSTVRNWSKEFAAQLSPAARGEQGDRVFDSRDLEVMRYAKTLREEGMAIAAIRGRLAETEFWDVAGPEETDVDPPPEEPITALQESSLPSMSATLLQVQTEALARMADRISERDSAGLRQVRGEVAQLRTFVWILAALILVLIVAVVVLWVVG